MKLFVFLLVVGLSCFTSALQSTTRVIQTPSGQLRGIVQDGVQQFLGVPFAQPPVGSLRWKAPILQSGWEGVLSASSYAPACMQSAFGQHIKMSEDCLYLNVFVPGNSTPSSPLPVRVWIYGGGYQLGSTKDYPSGPLATASNSVIVTVSYRVGLFGFFVLPQLVSESPVLNYGLQDQQVALAWVKKNIASFGGDANNVLIFGESAGASSVAMHLLMKPSWPLYQKAVLESPGPWRFPSKSQAIQLGEGIAGSIAQCSSTSDMLGCLRNLSAQDLFIAWLAVPQFGYGNLPCIDGQQILDIPAKLFSEGRMNPNVPIIVGNNWQEGNFLVWIQVYEIFNSTQLNITAEQYLTIMNLSVPPQFIPSVTAWYATIAEQKGYWHALSRLTGDFLINAGANLVATGALKAGNPVWRYVFAEDTVHSSFNFLNASHGAEMPYVFSNPAIFNATSFTPKEWAVSKQIVSYWTTFHLTGNPNDGKSYHWPQYLPAFSHFIKLVDGYGILDDTWDMPFLQLWVSVLLAG